MGEAGVAEKTIHALGEVLGMDDGEISLGATLVGDLQATSLDVVDLLYQLKKAFGIELTLADGRVVPVAGDTLDREASASVFERTGRVRRIDVHTAPGC